MGTKRTKGADGRRSGNGFARYYDADLINAEALAVCDHYLGERRREGRRYVYICPECAKPDFEVEPVKGLAGCFNPGCPMPKTTNALGIISHLEGLEPRGVEFIRCMEKGYEILGLAPSHGDAGPRTTGATRNGAKKRAAGNGRADGSAKGAARRSPEGGSQEGSAATVHGNGSSAEQGSPRHAPDEPAPGRPRGRTWVRQNGADGSAGEGPGRPAPRDERVYPVEAYFEGPNGEQIPTEAVIVDEGSETMELREADVGPTEPAEGLPPRENRRPREPHREPVEGASGDERELRHAVYERLLSLCPLEGRDARFFAGRGLDNATVEEGRFGSISARRSRWAARRLQEIFGEDLLRVPGFYRPEGDPKRVRFSLYGDYALIPYHDAEGRITTVEGRLIGEPKSRRDKKYKALLGSGVHLYVHPRFEPGEVVAFCEGAIGAMVAARYGVPVAAIKGFRNYKVSAREPGDEDTVLPELEGVDFVGRKIVYVPDMDVKLASREEVMGAVPAACEWLIGRQGGVPKVALLPDGAKDLDQWLLSLPVSERVAEAHRLLSEAPSLDEWSRSPEEGSYRPHAHGQDRSTNGRRPRATGTRGTTSSRRPGGSAGSGYGGKRDLLDDGDDAPADPTAADGAPEPEPRDAGDAPTCELRWDTDEAPRDGAESGGGETPLGGRPATRDAERARKGPMHPAMARWYEVAGYTEEQVAGVRRQTAMRRIAGERRPPVRDTPVALPRWTPGEVVLAAATAPAAAVVLCVLAYALRTQAGAVGVVGDLITWPSWWLEAALYAWAGVLAADWMVGRRHRTRSRQLEAHLRGEE